MHKRSPATRVVGLFFYPICVVIGIELYVDFQFSIFILKSGYRFFESLRREDTE